MPVKYKVVETFILDDGADEPELVAAIVTAATVPFDLSEPSIDRGVRFVNLVREGVEQSDDDPEPEQKANTADKGCQTEDSQWHEEDKQWKKRNWQDRQWKETEWQDRQAQESNWQWQGGNPCHVCGKVRAEHPGKKFCDVQEFKRARV